MTEKAFDLNMLFDTFSSLYQIKIDTREQAYQFGS